MMTSPEPLKGPSSPQHPDGRYGRPARSRRNRVRWVVLAIIGLAVAFVFVLPLLWMVVVSLRPVGLPPPRTVEWWPKDPNWGNYVEIFRQVPMARYLLNSLLVVAVSVPVSYTHLTLPTNREV